MRQIGLIILLFFTSLAYAQNVEFKASAPSVVAVGEQFKLEYTLNKEGDNLKVPTLEGFDLLMGPSVGQSFYSSNINGKMTQNVTFSYTYILEGTKKGTFQIPGATVIIDGKEYTSNALKIEVVEGSRNSNGNQAATNRPVQPDANATVNDNNLFVKVEVSRRSLYMGESLMATIKVYTKVDLVNLGRTKFPDFNGFLAEEVPTPQRIELVREAVDGQIYNVGTIRKVLLYPQHTGEITIEPFELECIVRQRLANGGRSFFDEFFGNYKDVRAMRRSKPVTIQVKELPQLGKPAGFGGTVGNVTMATSLSADTVNANDAITYKVTFRGTGNLKLLKAPTINFPLDFEVYDPKESRDLNITENGTTGSVSFEYLIIPRYSGDYKIPAIRFSYFDSQSNTYKTIAGAEYNIHVRKGADKGQVETSAGNQVKSFKKEDVRKVGEDIRYLKTEGLNLKAAGVRFFGTTLYWLALLIPFVLFVVGAVLNRRRIKANADIVRVKNKAANKMARKRLKVAASAMKNHNAEQFYDEVLKALWGYMSYKLNIDRAELNRDNISEILQSKGVEEDRIKEFIAVLDTCEYARYAPGSNSDQEMGKVYTDSIDVITKLDKAIR
ncbi:BatD family protein [Odoribacter splanchnicus]|uniref:BatD family protein n=1 Tax=Odoribacter splanchnicus TaxID=28118 RepID=UPI00210A0C7A|nr:BatD family protein [Odoribacter splanchnicus]MCQ4904378.1 BatD family protein [Odoribacter splanchnicus]